MRDTASVLKDIDNMKKAFADLKQQTPEALIALEKNVRALDSARKELAIKIEGKPDEATAGEVAV